MVNDSSSLLPKVVGKNLTMVRSSAMIHSSTPMRWHRSCGLIPMFLKGTSSVIGNSTVKMVYVPITGINDFPLKFANSISE